MKQRFVRLWAAGLLCVMGCGDDDPRILSANEPGDDRMDEDAADDGDDAGDEMGDDAGEAAVPERSEK